MRRGDRFAGLLLAAGGALLAQNGNSASVEGVVTNVATGAPVPRAHVSISVSIDGKQRSYGAITTAEGKFSITGMAPGDYGVTVERAGFFQLRGWGGLHLEPGEQSRDQKLWLTPVGAIAGKVVDADGAPVENCAVLAASRVLAAGAETDAQGRFLISGMVPGHYRIRATPDEPPGPPEIRTDGTVEEHYGETYYPGSLEESGGTKLDVRPGSTIDGIEIRLVRTPIVQVSGKVTGIAAGAGHISYTLMRLGEARRELGRSFTSIGGWSADEVKKDGTFRLWRLSPGLYRIGAQWHGGPERGEMTAAPVDVVVGDSNVEGIELRLMARADLNGQVEYEGDEAKPKDDGLPELWMQGVDGIGNGAAGRVDSSGAFTLTSAAPGRYHVGWRGRGYVKSVRLGSAETAGDVFDFAGGAGATLTVVISTRFASISGTVGTGGAPAGGLTVLLVSETRAPAVARGTQSIAVAADGSYASASVIPGTYRVSAVSTDDFHAIQVGGDEWEDYEPAAETVTIGAGEKVARDLNVLTQQREKR